MQKYAESPLWFHRIMVKTESDAREAVERLHANGHPDAKITHNDRRYGIAIDWASPYGDLELDYLRPDILPPKDA